MIHQIQVFAKGVLDRIYALLNSKAGSTVVSLRRIDVISPTRLASNEEIDTYVDGIRTKLYKALGDNDGVQIN
jgi:hypothetical protein